MLLLLLSPLPGSGARPALPTYRRSSACRASSGPAAAEPGAPEPPEPPSPRSPRPRTTRWVLRGNARAVTSGAPGKTRAMGRGSGGGEGGGRACAV